jgi:hypothetical protein
MNLFGTDVLLVGQTFLDANALVERLHRWGLQCRCARNLREATDLLSIQPVDLVLSNMYLSDGTPFCMPTALAGHRVTAFLCLQLEVSCLWLPALDAGEKCLGKPALRPSEFSSLLREMAQRLAAVPSVGWRESPSLPSVNNECHQNADHPAHRAHKRYLIPCKETQEVLKDRGLLAPKIDSDASLVSVDEPL